MRRIILASILLAASMSPASAHAQQEPRKLRIAGNLPLTGDHAVYGEGLRQGATLALEELPGRDAMLLDFNWQDNHSLPRTAVSIAELQLAQKPDIYMSGVRPQTLAIWERISRFGAPHFVWIFDRSIKNGYRNNFRMYLNFSPEAALVRAYAEKRAASRIAIIYVQLPSTQDAYETAMAPLLREAGATVMTEPYDLGESDFRSLGLRVKAFAPQMLFLSGLQGQLVSMVKAFNALKMIHDGNTVATYDMIDALPLLSGEPLEGMRVSCPRFLLDEPGSKYDDWSTRFKARFGRAPVYSEAYGYDAAMVLADVRRRLPETWSGEQLLAALRATQVEGITGPVHFDADGDAPIDVELGVVRQGRLVRDSGDLHAQ